MYWQLFAQVRFRRVLIIWIVILTGWTVAFILAGLLECGSHLMALFGTPDDYVQYCGAAEPSGWANVGSDVATDFITLIIPIPVVSENSAHDLCIQTDLIEQDSFLTLTIIA